MSLIRRRMMMAKEPDVPDTPTEELDYLTIIPLHEEEVEYEIRPYRGLKDEDEDVYTQDLPFYYRINKGEWVEVNLPEMYMQVFIIKLNKNTEFQLKCMGCNFSWSYQANNTFSITSKGIHNICGTPMSLLYGDGFKENNYVGNELLFGLFSYNPGLTQILNPKTFLPYTELNDNCYAYMFEGCYKLINAPELPAEILAFGCYTGMFYNCPKINYIKMLGKKMRETGDYTEYIQYCFQYWVYGVSSTGTFVKSKDATWDTTPGALGDSGVPAGWTVVNDGEESEGGNDFGIEFPLYLEFDYCDSFGLMTSCIRDADELGVKLYNCLTAISNEHGEDIYGNGSYIVVSGQILDMLGIEIYIENSKVVEVQKEWNSIYIITNGTYEYTSVHQNGSMTCDYE